MSNNKPIVCTMCGTEQVKVLESDSSDSNQINNGIHLLFIDGYGMFTDFFSELDVVLCHDCVIKVLSLFPQKFKDKFLAGHSEESAMGCGGCDYSFKWEVAE
jgi:hypothetical protein